MSAPVYRRRTLRPGRMPPTRPRVACVWSYERSFGGVDGLERFRLEDEPIGRSIEAPNGQELRHAAASVDACNVHDQVDRQSDGFADASVRQSDVRREDAMRHSRQCLVGGVCVDRAQASKVTGIEGLQEVECLSPAYLADDDAIGPVPECCAEQVGDRDSGQRRLMSERHLRASRFESEEIRLLKMDFRGLLDYDDPVAI